MSAETEEEGQMVPPETAAEQEVPSAESVAAPAEVAPGVALLTTPRRPRPVDWALTAFGLAGLAILMTRQGHLRVGVPLGMLLAAVAVVGLLGLLGDSPLQLRGDERASADETPRGPWWKREGVWVLLFGGALYLPMAGAYGLWDPWETHYSEVAREILSRDDWITTWWGQEGWFMSKPVLIFWMSALGMGVGSLFGLRTAPDGGPQFQEWCIRVPISLLAMLALWGLYRAVASAFGRRAGMLVAFVLATMPHWFFIAHQAMTDLPFVGPLVLAVSMLMLAITSGDKLAEPFRVNVFGYSFRWSLWHSAIGLFLLLAVPQVMYLLTRTMVTSCPEDARMVQCEEMLRLNRMGGRQFPVETYFYGSAGNSADTLEHSVPGSPKWERLLNVIPFFPSVVQGLVWIVLGALALTVLRRERRAKDLYFILFYIWCAISTMGKGPAGLVIPAGIAGAYLVTSRDWALLRRARPFTGLLVFLVVAMPWYVAILGRLGNEFFDRFVVHDIINRTIVGVHGDTGSVRYFIWQLGYGMFPWSGLVPVALVGWRQIVPADSTPAQRAVARIGLLWFVLSFVLFSAMITKFHHYIFPAVPGAAVMVGLLVDRLLGTSSLTRAKNPVGSLAALGVGITALVVGVASFVGSARGIVPRSAEGTALPGSPALGATLCLIGAAALVASWWFARGESPEAPAGEGVLAALRSDDTPERTERARALGADVDAYRAISLGAMAVAGVAVLAFVARDLAYDGTTRPPGYQRLLQLFTYQYERMWPSRSFNYHAILVGFGVVAVLACAGLVVHRLRPMAARAMVAVAFVFAAWGLDFYMVDVSRHWSQRSLFERYYARRQARTTEGREGEDARYDHDPIGAYQMNWKGENFYTGGRCAMLDCGDLPFCSNHIRPWLERHRGQRVYFVTERSHGSNIVSQVTTGGGNARELTDEWDQNKFVLIEATAGPGRPGAPAAAQ
jgi:4-amino-4-deoxy-L-arabinose transferase-like glycosyltransferase